MIKTIYIIINFVNDTENIKIFENRKWLISVAIIVYFLFSLFKAYAFCNEKYYLEKRVISITNYMLLYGIYGTVLISIYIIILNNIPCGDDTIPEIFKTICDYDEDKKAYYFVSYNIYFKKLSSEFLGWKLVLQIFQCILFYSSTYYSYVIYKKLNPIYHLCMYHLNSLIFTIFEFINELANNDNIAGLDKILNILDFLILFFYLIGSIVYLEFIELNFCGLNFYTKRKIQESLIQNLYVV